MTQDEEGELTIGRAIDIFESVLSLIGESDAREKARFAVVKVDDDEFGSGLNEMGDIAFVNRVSTRIAIEFDVSQSELKEHFPLKYAPSNWIFSNELMNQSENTKQESNDIDIDMHNCQEYSHEICTEDERINNITYTEPKTINCGGKKRML